MTKSIVDRPPGKLLRFGLHLPIWLYRLKMGWLLGERFLLLTHIGRNSSLPHQTVIEVVHSDKKSDTYFVVSGWGEKSDWYQNLRKSPTVTICVGRRKFESFAKFIPQPKALEILEIYAREHPIAFHELSSLLLGKGLQPGKDAAQGLAAKMPMVAFHPTNLSEQV